MDKKIFEFQISMYINKTFQSFLIIEKIHEFHSFLPADACSCFVDSDGLYYNVLYSSWHGLAWPGLETARAGEPERANHRESNRERRRERGRERAKEGDSSAWAGALMHQNNQLQLPCYACH